MNKHVCAECRKYNHLSCSSLRQARVIIETKEPSPDNLPVCVCACFGQFLPKKEKERLDHQKMRLQKKSEDSYTNREFRLKGRPSEKSK